MKVTIEMATVGRISAHPVAKNTSDSSDTSRACVGVLQQRLDLALPQAVELQLRGLIWRERCQNSEVIILE